MRNRFTVNIPPDHSEAPADITKIGEDYVNKKFVNFSFPKNETKRCFQPSWIQKFPWIEYSVERDAVFCYPCRQFPTTSASRNLDMTFTRTGFRSWAAALQNQKGFARHERSDHHIKTNG